MNMIGVRNQQKCLWEDPRDPIPYLHGKAPGAGHWLCLVYSHPDRDGISSSVGRGSCPEGSLDLNSGLLLFMMHKGQNRSLSLLVCWSSLRSSEGSVGTISLPMVGGSELSSLPGRLQSWQPASQSLGPHSDPRSPCYVQAFFCVWVTLGLLSFSCLELV